MGRGIIPFKKLRHVKASETRTPGILSIVVTGPWKTGEKTALIANGNLGRNAFIDGLNDQRAYVDLQRQIGLSISPVGDAIFTSGGFTNLRGTLAFSIKVKLAPGLDIDWAKTRAIGAGGTYPNGAFQIGYIDSASADMDEWDDWDDWDPDDDLYSDVYGAGGAVAKAMAEKAFYRRLKKALLTMENPEASDREIRKAKRLFKWMGESAIPLEMMPERAQPYVTKPPPKRLQKVQARFISGGGWGDDDYYGSLLGAAAVWGAKKAIGKGVSKYMDAYQTASDPDADPREKRKAVKFLERIHRRIPESTLSPETQAASRWMDLFRRDSGYPTQQAVEELIED